MCKKEYLRKHLNPLSDYISTVIDLFLELKGISDWINSYRIIEYIAQKVDFGSKKVLFSCFSAKILLL